MVSAPFDLESPHTPERHLLNSSRKLAHGTKSSRQQGPSYPHADLVTYFILVISYFHINISKYDQYLCFLSLAGGSQGVGDDSNEVLYSRCCLYSESVGARRM